MELQDAFDAQLDLQIKNFGQDPRGLDEEKKVEYLTWNVLASLDELHEALAEFGWKPWASSKHVNRDAVISELVDLLHFQMNMLISLDCDAREFLAKYFEKRGINAKRQDEGYDGVTGKCPSCKRALDDVAVHCTTDKCASWE